MSEDILQLPLPSSVPIDPGDWARTPHSVQVVVLALEERVKKLEAEVAELTDRLNVNSSNSSKPPSSDFPGSRPRTRVKSAGRKQGAQPGHQGTNRARVGADKINRVVDCFPQSCEHCGDTFTDDCTDAEPVVHQVTDLPFASPETTEYRRHRRRCGHCSKVTLATLPAAVPTGAFGPGVQATVAYYSGARRCSRREVERIMQDIHNVDLSVGSVSAIEEQVSIALTPCVDEAREEVRQSKVVHQDETGWREANEKAWLWVAANTFLAVFVIAKTRKGSVSQEMLKGFKGFLVTDRFKGYLWYELAKRAICWAHLKRDFQ
jgi:transposase